MRTAYGLEKIYLLDSCESRAQDFASSSPARLLVARTSRAILVNQKDVGKMTRRFKLVATAAVAVTVLAGAGLTAIQSADAAVHTAAPLAAVAGWSKKSLPNPYRFLPKVPSFRVTSTTVTNGKALKLPQFSGVFGVKGGEDISPQLSWSGFPKGTKSFVVSMYDPEAPTGSGFWHWVVADIPASTHSLKENAGALASKALPAGAFQLDADSGLPRYIGAAPPAHSGEHDYFITVTALDTASTGLKATTSGALLGFTIDGHTLARATIVAPTIAK
jgi:Raf kinase inhibitor-like YbhB/YbcL family protein